MKRFVVLVTLALLFGGCGHAAPSHAQIAGYMDRWLNDCNGYAMYGQCAIIGPTSAHCLSVRHVNIATVRYVETRVWSALLATQRLR
jgi:hypothetical protein